MLLFEKKNNQIRMVLDCDCPRSTNLARLVLNSLSWDPRFKNNPNYIKSFELLNGEIDLEEGEQIIIVGVKNDK